MPVGAWYVRALALAGALAALVPALVMWGFTVDDALIPVRYAHHVVTGVGYRFDAAGPATDGVTPLPWAILCAPLAYRADLLVALARVKVLGVVAWTLSGGALGRAIALRARPIVAAAALSVVALAFPIGAWSASGMETGLATALATGAAVAFETPRRAALLAGLAATLRPELAPWAITIASGAAVAKASGRTAVAKNAAIALAPFALCALVRVVCFGRVAPLALLAKPSDLQHGLLYAPAAALVVLTPVLAVAPFALRRASVLARTLAVAALVHVVVVVAVGGDWMPYARLMVPVAPSLALAFADTASVARPWSNRLRVTLAFFVAAFVCRSAAMGRNVYGARNELVERARPVLASSRVVAALDIGWVGAATDARIVDLAGLTDPAIAVLPGGHTSKKIDTAMLLDRGVDTVIVYGEPRIVEQRLVHAPLFDERFERSATLEFGALKQRYYVYRLR